MRRRTASSTPHGFAVVTRAGVATRLQRFDGIGPFYSELVTVRALGHTDVLPNSEPRVIAATGLLVGEPNLTPAAFAEIAAGVATVAYLVGGGHPGIVLTLGHRLDSAPEGSRSGRSQRSTWRDRALPTGPPRRRPPPNGKNSSGSYREPAPPCRCDWTTARRSAVQVGPV